MNGLVRFGRKIPMPSTREIKHDLRMMAAADALVEATSARDVEHIVDDLAGHLGLSAERAQTLADRFGLERRTHEVLARGHAPI